MGSIIQPITAQKHKYTFIDLFAGIGGFHQAMHSVGMKCVFASEIDENARKSYMANYSEVSPELFDDDCLNFNRDITKQEPKDIPDFDVCCAGFPCQPFSVAGLKKGFEDTRGTLFFCIANIVKCKCDIGTPPKVLFLENVKGLKTHDKGRTLEVILATLDELGYAYKYEVLNAKYFGVPQNRERLFIIAWHKELVPAQSFIFPYGVDEEGQILYSYQAAKERSINTRLSDVLEPDNSIDPKFTISDRMWKGHQDRKERNRQAGKGFGYSLFTKESKYCSTISARYWKDGSEILIDQSEKGLNPRTLTPVEAGRLQGYLIEGNGWCNGRNQIFNSQELLKFRIVVSKKEAYRQFGNSVALPVIRALAVEIKKQLLDI